MMKALLPLTTLVVLATGCTSTPTTTLPENATACSDPRPNVCTMDYRPVIGYNSQGESQGEFGNACGACVHDDIQYSIPVDR